MTALKPVYFLLVDDLKENLLALEALLRRDGLVLLTASSGEEALELLLQYEVALALVDIQMPGMNGFELAELIRSTERTRSVPIIFLTAGNADQQRRFRGYEAGAVDFLQKPIEADILKGKATVFFELYRQRQEVERQRDELKAATEENVRLLDESRQYAEALKEADHRKDQFLATLAHELRNPLAPIRNGLQLLRTESRADRAEMLREMMELQLNHMVHLIDDLLDMSRVSLGKIDLRKECLPMQKAIDSALETSKPLLEEKHHNLTLAITDEPLCVDADFTRMSQIISNLVCNAAKYTPAGGQITLSLAREHNSAVLRVSDNGVGIERHMLDKIFGLFTQVRDSMEQSQGGLGIGLALVQRLVDMHGGIVQAQSMGLGQGSEFIVKLPVVQTEKQQETIEMPLEQPSSAPLKILVVDDNVASAKTIAWMLEAIGHEATLAHNGEETLVVARSMNPDVILLDIGLPGMNGYDICRMLRQESQFKDTVLIAQTGWGQKRDKELAQEAGFNHHLIKPVDFDHLSHLLSGIRA